MNDTDYQVCNCCLSAKGSFELFNQNIVYETQITTLKSQLDNLTKELETYKSVIEDSEETY